MWLLSVVVLTLISTSSGQNTDQLVEMLVARVDALEQQGVALQRQMEVQQLQHERREQALVEDLSEQKQLTTELQARVEVLEQEVSEQGKLNNAHEDQVYQKDVELLADDSDVDGRDHQPESTGKRNRSSRFVMEPEQPVAFHALLGGHEHTHMGIHQNIKFDTVQVNLGAAYHPQHGIFIAPQSGVYLFSTTVLTTKLSSHQSLVAYLMKNGTALGKIWAYGADTWHDSSSMTAVAQLQTGDEVWVEVENADQSIWGDMYTAFSGTILYSA